MSASKSKKNVVISAEDLMRPYVIDAKLPAPEVKLPAPEVKLPALEVKSVEKSSSPFTTPTQSLALADNKKVPEVKVTEVKIPDIVGLKNSEKLEAGEDIEVCYDIKNKKIIFVSTKGRLISALHVPELNGDVDKMVRYGSIKHKEFRFKYVV
jgi:hypothetical protein